MKPVNFHKDCILFAEDQPEYETLPVLKVQGELGIHFTSCWVAGIWERIRFLFSGKVYLMVLGHQPPASVAIHKPFESKKSDETT